MSATTTVNMSPTNKMTQFVANHAPKAMHAGFWGLMIPGIVVSTGLAVSFATKGKVNPVKFFEKPHVAGKMETWMKTSAGVFASSCVATMAVDGAAKKAKNHQ